MSTDAPVLTAKADYSRNIEYPVSGSPYKVGDWIDVSSAVSATITGYTATTQNINNFTYAVNGGYGFTYNTSLNQTIDLSNITSIRFRFASVSGGSVKPSDITTASISIVFSGSDPDTGVKSQEQRYNTNTLYSADFTQSNSLPLIYSGSLFLSDFTPNGNCNSIQVDASTVGGDQLEWRLNLGQSGIDGQSAWVPIGFKLPIEVGAFDEHSVQLRMKDPNDPTQYYQLQPSELSMCAVTYGYMTDVYLSLPPAEYQTLPTQEMPTFATYTVPTAPNVSDYVTAPASVFTSIFNMFMSSPVAIVFTVLIFAFVIKCVIW